MKFYKTLTINGIEYPLAVPMSGTGVPTFEAEIGMFYTNVTTGDVYKYTVNGWELLSSNDDLEAALDGILAIQKELMKGYAVTVNWELCTRLGCKLTAKYTDYFGEEITVTKTEEETSKTFTLKNVDSDIVFTVADGFLKVSVDGEVLFDGVTSADGSTYTLEVNRPITVDIGCWTEE